MTYNELRNDVNAEKYPFERSQVLARGLVELLAPGERVEMRDIVATLNVTNHIAGAAAFKLCDLGFLVRTFKDGFIRTDKDAKLLDSGK